MLKQYIWFERVLFVVFSLIILTNLWFAMTPMSQIGEPQVTIFFHGMDFTLRLNEIECVKDGVDPYEIRSGNLDRPPYCSFLDRQKLQNGYNKPLDVYTPWEYVYMMPFSWVPRQVAWYVHIAFKFVSLLIIGAFAYAFSRRSLGASRRHALFLALFSLVVITFPTWRDFENGNFGVTITASVILMVACLNRGHSLLAGCLWAFAMFKPQMALPLVFPLLIKKRFFTIGVAAFVCAVGAVPASLMTHTPYVTLLRHSIFGGVNTFVGCGVIPYPFVLALRQLGLPDGVIILLAMAIASALCVWLTWVLRECQDWFWLILPAAVCGVVWTYTGWSNYCLNVMPLLGLLFMVSREMDRRTCLLCFFFLPFLACFYLGFHEITTTCSGIFSWCQMSEGVHQTFHTFEATAIALALFPIVRTVVKCGIEKVPRRISEDLVQ